MAMIKQMDSSASLMIAEMVVWLLAWPQGGRRGPTFGGTVSEAARASGCLLKLDRGSFASPSEKTSLPPPPLRISLTRARSESCDNTRGLTLARIHVLPRLSPFSLI